MINMNNLNNVLFKDLIESTDFKKNKSVRNPLNIISMLESSHNLPQKAKEYLKKLKLKESNFTEKNTRKVSGIFCKILNEESVFIKRFDFLLSKVESILPFSLKILDLKSISILKHSIECGLDINGEINNTYLLKHAIETKNTIIMNYLYSLPTINKLKVDKENNNLAHLLCINKNYNLINQLSNEHIDLFYLKNKNNKTPIDILFNYKQYTTLPNNMRFLIKKTILMFLHLHHSGDKILSNETYNIIMQSTVLKDIVTEANYMKLTNKLISKTNMQLKTKVNKI